MSQQAQPILKNSPSLVALPKFFESRKAGNLNLVSKKELGIISKEDLGIVSKKDLDITPKQVEDKVVATANSVMFYM